MHMCNVCYFFFLLPLLMAPTVNPVAQNARALHKRDHYYVTLHDEYSAGDIKAAVHKNTKDSVYAQYL